MPLPDFSGGRTGISREGYWADIVVVDPEERRRSKIRSFLVSADGPPSPI